MQDFYSLDMRPLCNTILLASYSARAVRAVSVAILIRVALRNSLAPRCATLEVNVVYVGTRVNDVDVNTLAATIRVEVFVEVAERETAAMRDASKTPGSVLLDGRVGGVEGMYLLVSLDEFDLSRFVSSCLHPVLAAVLEYCEVTCSRQQ